MYVIRCVLIASRAMEYAGLRAVGVVTHGFRGLFLDCIPARECE